MSNGTAVLEKNTVSENLIAKRDKKIKRFKLVLNGLSALLTDPMSDETLNMLRTGEKVQIDKQRSLEEIAQGKLYLDDEGEITMPATCLRAALNYAGKYLKYDAKRSIATNDTSLIPSFMRIEGEFLTFVHDGWKPDQRRGRLDNGTAVSIVRPKFKSWSVEVVIQLDDTQPIKIETVIALFEKAGAVSGLGVFRPSCKGEFGQFEVESCHEISLK